MVLRDERMDLLMSRDPETITNCGRGTQFWLVQTNRNSHSLRGLTPDLFWAFRSTLLATPRSSLETVIDALVNSQASRDGRPTELDWTSALKPVHAVCGRLLSTAICELPDLSLPLPSVPFKSLPPRLAIILISPHTPDEHGVEGDGDFIQNILWISLPAAVSAHSNFFLYNILPRAIPFARKRLIEGDDVCVACPTGKNLGPGVIVAALSLFFNDGGDLICGNDTDSKGGRHRRNI